MITWWRGIRELLGKIPVWEGFILVGILVLAGYFRYVNLRLFPGWYTDEGAFINVSSHLAQGEWQYFAIKGSPLLVGRPPLFFVILAGLFLLFGEKILILRMLSATCGLLSVGLVYLAARRIGGRRLAIWSALLLAIFPEAVAYSRIGFTYNLLAPLFLIVGLSLGEYYQSRTKMWLYFGAILSGLAFAVDYVGIVIVILVFYITIRNDSKSLWKVVMLCMGPAVLLIMWLWIGSPQETIDDLIYSFLRSGSSISMQIGQIVVAYGETMRQVFWVPLSIFGVALLPDKRVRIIYLFIFTFTLLFLARLILPFGQGYYYLIPLFPIMALGIGRIVDLGVTNGYALISNEILQWIDRLPGIAHQRYGIVLRIPGTMVSVVGIFTFLIIPIIWLLLLDIQALSIGSQDINRFVSITHFTQGMSNATDASEVAEYINLQIEKDRLVIASPQLAWALRDPVADFQQMMACEGEEAFALPKMDTGRFAYDCSVQSAQLVVIDDLWKGWAVHVMPGLKQRIKTIQEWPMILQIGEFTVYKNPEV